MPSEEELWTMLREAYNLPYGSSQISLVEQVVQHADAAGLEELQFQARMLATSAYVYGGEQVKSFVTFSWCLAEHDRHPERYDAGDAGNLLWHFKYMVTGVTKFPEIPLERAHAVLDDMERRFRVGGHSLHAVYSHRWVVAEHIGDHAAADDWYVKWCAAPRDDNSDCVGCDPTSKVQHLTTRGRDEEAVVLAEPVIAGHLTCSEQPQMILTELLFPYVRTGRLAEAADAHRRAYRAIRGKLADLTSIAVHVEFLARTGNEVRGLEIVERHLEWLDRAPSPFAEMSFAAAAAVLMRRLCDTGHGALTVHRRADDDIEVARLADDLAARARTIAARFDERNGTTYIGDVMERRLTAEPLVDSLPLSALDAAVRTRAAPPPPTPEPPPVIDQLPDEPEPLLEYAERQLRVQRFDAADAALREFDERYPSPDPLLAARRLDDSGLRAAADGRTAEAEETFVRACEAYTAAGDELSGMAAQARALSLVEHHDSRYETSRAELESLTERIIVAAADDPERRAGALLRLAVMYGRGGDIARAEEYCVQAREELGEADLPLVRAEVDIRLAHVRQLQQRYDEAAELAGAAVDMYRGLGNPPAIAIACVIAGEAAASLDRMEDAFEAFDTAVRVAVDDDLVAASRVGRGRALLTLGRAAEAVTDLVESVAESVARGLELPSAALRFDLALAYQRTGQLLDAAEAAETALRVFEQREAQDAADRTRYLLSRIYRETGGQDEADRALELLEQLAVNLDGFDNLPARGQMYEEAGQILYQADRDALAASRFGSAAEAYRAAGLKLDELRASRWRALSLRWADDTEAALAALAEADAFAATLDMNEPAIAWEQAMLDYDAARIYIAGGQGEEALARVSTSAATFRRIESWSEALQADLLYGELLLRLDRADEAEAVLRSVLGGAPHDSQVRESAVFLLCEALEALGRDAEAEALRREQGVE
jgi:tetratricopeptide (TPR) repeat protein